MIGIAHKISVNLPIIMRTHHHLNTFRDIKNPVLTTGTFDGVHLGHQKIISRINEIAKQSGGESTLLTFYPHPRMVLFPEDNELKLLNTQEEKALLLSKYGIQHLIIYPFTKQFSRLSSVDFVRNVIVNEIGTKKLVIGYNHHFGRNREGSFDHLREYGPLYGFDVEEIPAKEIDDVEISSTKIRKALEDGNIETANKFLGYQYMLTGKVVAGKKIGKTIGYPTANIEIGDKLKLVPKLGIYVASILYDKKVYGGMLSIGTNPTVGGKHRTIEVNIFDFDKEIYGEVLQINLIKRLRDESKFDGLESLKIALNKDKADSQVILSSSNYV